MLETYFFLVAATISIKMAKNDALMKLHLTFETATTPARIGPIALPIPFTVS